MPTPPVPSVKLKDVEVEIKMTSPPTVVIRPLNAYGCFLMGELNAVLRAHRTVFDSNVTDDLVELSLSLRDN